MNIQRIKHYSLASLMLVMMLTAHDAAAFGTLDDQAKSPLTASFKSLDKNANGTLSREESSHDSDIGDRFDHADFNNDGKLSEQEYADSKSRMQQARVQSFLEDSTVTAKVKTELLKDNGIRGLTTISVETHHGHVILSGFVDSEEQIRRAAEIASGIRGVTSVKNSLVLKG